MKLTNRIYTLLLFEFLFIIISTLYLTFTVHAYPYNYILFMVACLVIIVGFIRELIESMIIGILVVFGYGTYILYRMYIAQNLVDVSFNDLFWLFMLPVGTIFSGYLGTTYHRLVDQFNKYEKIVQNNQIEDEVTELTNYRQFKKDLTAEVYRSLRYKHSMTVLLVRIAFFREMQKEFGAIETEKQVKRIAGKIDSLLRNEDRKAYVDEGTFALILPETPIGQIDKVQNRLEETFQLDGLSRSSKYKSITIRLRFGAAGCPEDGKEPMEIYEKALHSLQNYVE